ncbi:MAG TPA: IS21 family transposase [Vicinamibacterales bacterium]|jgi:transposase
MRQLREMLRLKHEVGLTHRAVARACHMGLGSVTAYLQRAAAAGLTWPLPVDLDDEALERRLFARPGGPPAADRVLPDPGTLHQELKRPGVTLHLLWTEYRATHPEGYAYSQFCERYRQWVRTLKPSMRQVHRAGEKVFVDYAGQHPHVIDRTTGQAVAVELFVGVLGASGLVYAEATRGQDLGSWVSAHVHMLETWGGSAAIWVPDNLKSAVAHAHRYEPTINRTYLDLAHHYGAVVLPARVRHPQDNALAEIGVLLAERWVLAALRHHTFFTLEDLNAAIRERVAVINDRPLRRVGESRRALFERLDRPALKPLPTQPFELATWTLLRVNIDYHVAFDHNVYSVPYALVHEQVEARVTSTTIEIFFKGRRVASHVRLSGRGQASTHADHMPRGHREYAEWTPARVIAWAARTGPATGRVVAGILEQRAHPEQGFRACLGLLRLGERHDADRLEAACLRAEHLRSYSYRTVDNILRHGQDRVPLPDAEEARRVLPFHSNIRGAAYYRRKGGVC